MRMRIERLPRAVVRLGLVVVAVLAVGGAAYGAIPDSGTQVYSACMLNNVGSIRLIDPSLPASSRMSHCTGQETLVTWNQAGQAGATGAKGDTGAKGNTGASAYELAHQNGFAGSLSEWLISLVGPKGDKGDTGDTGTPGASAYEIAQANGFTGTEAEWLASLQGQDGTQGDTGPQGDPGTSVTSTAVAPDTDSNCPGGGTKFTVGTTVTYACPAGHDPVHRGTWLLPAADFWQTVGYGSLLESGVVADPDHPAARAQLILGGTVHDLTLAFIGLPANLAAEAAVDWNWGGGFGGDYDSLCEIPAGSNPVCTFPDSLFSETKVIVVFVNVMDTHFTAQHVPQVEVQYTWHE